MDWQLTFAVCAVAVAGAYVVWQGWRTWRGAKSGCSGGCGCAKSNEPRTTAVIPPEELTLRTK